MYLHLTFEGLLKLMLVSLAITICIFTINAILIDTNTPVNKIKEAIKDNGFVFKEEPLNEFYSISGAIKVESIGKMEDVEKYDEALNKTTIKEFKYIRTDGYTGSEIYRVTFKDGTTKRYYNQWYRGMPNEWLLLDFGPYKN